VNSRQSTAPAARPGLIIAILATCGIVVSIMQGLVMPLLSSLPDLLNTSASNAAWVVTSTLLAGAVVTPIGGRLGDMLGKRLILLVFLGMLTLGSLLCALTSSLVLVVIGRALQGAASGAIPLAISLLRDELPPRRLGSGIATISATLGVGAALGMAVSALIVQAPNWHVLCWVSAGLGGLCFLLVVSLVPESPVRAPARFDTLGCIGLAIGLVALLLAVSKGSDWGWSSGTVIGLFVGACVVLTAWGLFELRVKAPMVNLRISAKPQVLCTNLASLLAGFALIAMSLVFIQQLMAPIETGYGMGLSMFEAGISLAPSGIVVLLVSPMSARLSAKRGPKVTLMAGMAIMAAGYLSAILLGTQVWQIILASVIIGAGLGVAYASMPALIMRAVPQSETAAANGLNTLVRSMGSTIASAVIGALLARMTMTMGQVTLPSQRGFQVALLISGSAAILALIVAAFIPTGRRGNEWSEDADTADPAGNASLFELDPVPQSR